jgi:hypothetical protein
MSQNLNNDLDRLLEKARNYLQRLSKDSHKTGSKRMQITYGSKDLTKSSEIGFKDSIPLEYFDFQMISTPPNVEASGKLTEGSIIMGPVVVSVPLRSETGDFMGYFGGGKPLTFSVAFVVKKGKEAHIKRGYEFCDGKILGFEFFRTPLGDDYKTIIVAAREIRVLERDFDANKKPLGKKVFMYKIPAS